MSAHYRWSERSGIVHSAETQGGALMGAKVTAVSDDQSVLITREHGLSSVPFVYVYPRDDDEPTYYTDSTAY